MSVYGIYIKEILVSSLYKFDVTCVTCVVLLGKPHIIYVTYYVTCHVTCHVTFVTCHKSHHFTMKNDFLAQLSITCDQMTLVKYQLQIIHNFRCGSLTLTLLPFKF